MQQETEECFIEEKAKATQFEAALNIREETSDTARKHVSRLEAELDRIEVKKLSFIMNCK